jgi:hypothetical protein
MAQNQGGEMEGGREGEVMESKNNEVAIQQGEGGQFRRQ